MSVAEVRTYLYTCDSCDAEEVAYEDVSTGQGGGRPEDWVEGSTYAMNGAPITTHKCGRCVRESTNWCKGDYP